MVDIAKIVGDRTRIIRTEKGLTQEESAHRAEIDASHFGKMERGEVNKLNTLTVKEQKLILTLLDVLFKLMKHKA